MIRSVASSRHLLLTALLAVVPLSACDFNDAKDDEEETEEPIDPSTPVSYTEIRTRILEPSCIGCHSAVGGNAGGVNLESYANVKAAAADIKSSTVDTTRMPAGGGTLSANLRALLGAWIAQGTPE